MLLTDFRTAVSSYERPVSFYLNASRNSPPKVDGLNLKHIHAIYFN